jgi:hypothetical protein
MRLGIHTLEEFLEEYDMIILQYETQIDEDGGITLPLLPEYGGRRVVVYVDAFNEFGNDRMLIYDTRIAQDGGITLPLFPQKQNGLPVIVSVEGESRYDIEDNLPTTFGDVKETLDDVKGTVDDIVNGIGSYKEDNVCNKICEELMWRIERLLDEKIKP